MRRYHPTARAGALLLTTAMAGSAFAGDAPVDCFNDAHAETAQQSPAQPEALRITDADLAALLAAINNPAPKSGDFELPPAKVPATTSTQ